MNITRILYELLPLLGITASDLQNEENTAKTLMKKVRLKLKELHPDAGGDAEQFDRLHKVYETLLVYKKQSKEFEQDIKIGVTQLTANANTLKNTWAANKNVSFEDVLNETVKKFKKHNFYVQVDIAELVLHFNKLAYCQAQELASLLHDLVSIPIELTAIESVADNKVETTVVNMTRCVKHNLAGVYNLDIALSVKKDSKIKVRIPGFELEQEYVVKDSTGFTLVFEENLVKLTILVMITLEP